MRKYLAFDIEIAKDIPNGVSDLMSYRPLGITCAATSTRGGQPRLWHGWDARGGIAGRMTPQEAQELVRYLRQAMENGYTILTWNGVGFDFDILGEESGLVDECRELALDHVDMMFHFFCLNGFPLALNKAAKGMGLSGKSSDVNGALAPKMWAAGRRQEVLDYVAQDSRTVLEVAEAIESQRAISWTSNRGNLNRLPMPRLLTVREALDLPLPDTSWMRDPWPRRKFVGWLATT